MKKILLLMLYGVFISLPKGIAQSTLINAMPLEYNPSFAGSAGKNRLASSIYVDKENHYWSSLQFSETGFSAYRSSLVGDNFIQKISMTQNDISYDQFFSKIRCGLGFTLNYSTLNGKYSSINQDSILQSSSGFNSYNSNNLTAGVAISPKFSINGRCTIAPSLQGLFRNGSSNFYGYKDRTSFFILKAGILFNTKKLYIGYSIQPVSKSERVQGFKYYKNPFYSNFQAGYTFQRKDDSKFSFSPLFVFYLDHSTFNSFRSISPIFNHLVMNLNFKYENILAGIVTGNGRYGLMAGYQNKKIKLMYVFYSSPFTKAKFEGQLSLKYLFNSEPNKRTPISSYQ